MNNTTQTKKTRTPSLLRYCITSQSIRYQENVEEHTDGATVKSHPTRVDLNQDAPKDDLRKYLLRKRAYRYQQGLIQKKRKYEEVEEDYVVTIGAPKEARHKKKQLTDVAFYLRPLRPCLFRHLDTIRCN